MAGPHSGSSLYRHYDRCDKLLYVGLSIRPLLRLNDHRHSPWFRKISKVTITHYKTRHEASIAERSSIKRERPKFNSQLRTNPRTKIMPIALAIVDYRLENCIPASDLAKQIGISPTTLWKFENGREISGTSSIQILQWILQDKPETLEHVIERETYAKTTTNRNPGHRTAQNTGH